MFYENWKSVGQIVIAGGAGFLGTHLALALKHRGADVAIVDSFSTNNIAQFLTDTSPHRDSSLKILHARVQRLRQADIPLYTIDCRNYAAISSVLDRIKPQKLLHFCAISHAGRSNRDRHEAFECTMLTLRNCLDYAIGAKIEQFVFQSSSLRYGNFSGPAQEDDKLNPIGYYGSLKVAGELLVKAAHQVHGLPVTITVPSALYGPRCVSRRVVQVFIENCLEYQPLQIAGDGEERIDFTYVEDWVQAMLLILSKKEALNQTFNVTYGESRSLNELVECLRAYWPSLAVEHTEWDQAYPSRDALCIDKAKSLLGYQPQFPLERGLSQYVEYYRDCSAR